MCNGERSKKQRHQPQSQRQTSLLKTQHPKQHGCLHKSHCTCMLNSCWLSVPRVCSVLAAHLQNEFGIVCKLACTASVVRHARDLSRTLNNNSDCIFTSIIFKHTPKITCMKQQELTWENMQNNASNTGPAVKTQALSQQPFRKHRHSCKKQYRNEHVDATLTRHAGNLSCIVRRSQSLTQPSMPAE